MPELFRLYPRVIIQGLIFKDISSWHNHATIGVLPVPPIEMFPIDTIGISKGCLDIIFNS